MTVSLALLAAAVVAHGFFAGAEAAFGAVDRDALDVSASEGDGAALAALDLLDRQDQLAGACGVAATTCLVVAGTLAAGLVADRGLAPEVWGTALLAPVALVLGDALPRAVYAHHADTVAPLAARPLRLLVLLLRPVLVLGSAWSALLRRLPGEPPTLSRQGIVDLLDEAHGGSDIAPQERAMIRRLLHLDETPVESCMTPLVDVIAVPDTATIAEAVAKVLQHGKSRIAVFHDRVDNIVGIVDYRDPLFTSEDHELPVASIVRPVRYVPESQKGSVLLRELRHQAEHLAVVVDEYGGAVGLVTLEDLLEEVVGEIRDERDKAGPGIRRLSERDWRVPARLEVEEVSAAVGHPLPEGDYETVAGLVLARLGRIPDAGEVVRIGGFTVHIEAASERAIQTVRLTTPPNPKAP